MLSTNWEQTRPVHSYEDRLVLSYAKFLHELDGLDGLAYDRYLALRPVLAELHYLACSTDTLSFEGRGRQVSVVGLPRIPEVEYSAAAKDRALVRALVVGDAPPEEIADTLDLQVETIRLYEHLAWDVRSRLKKRGWLHNFVFGENMLGNTSVLDFERLCLLTVYKHGVPGLKRLLFLDPMTHQQYVEDMRQQLRVDMAAKAGVSLATMPLNSHTIPEVVTGYNNWEKTERELQLRALGQEDGGAAGDRDLKDGLVAAIKDASFTVPDGPIDSNPSAEEHQGDEAFCQALLAVMLEAGIEQEAGRA